MPPHTRDWAVKLLARLKLPAEAETMLEESSYWNPTICEIYFERCDEAIFQNPGEGLKLAQVAPRLALLVPETEELGGPQAYRERLIQAYAILGSAHRTMGSHSRADEVYSLALEIEAEGEVSPPIRAKFYQRLSVLRVCQKRFQEAHELLDKASQIYESHEDDVARANCLVKRGYVYALTRCSAEAIECFGEALKLIPNPPNKPGEAARTHHSAVHNLAGVITFATCMPEDLGRARGHARRTRRLIRSRRSVPKAKLTWIEGLVLIQLGSTRRGEKCLKSARHSLRVLRAPFDYALVSLDLSAFWHSEGRWESLEALAAETYKTFRELGGSADSEALAALSLWVDGVRARTLNRELIRETSRRIAARGPVVA